ncbi:hypothetical protein HFO93_22395 [Rhizobium leguminosarum]|uniref:hypothetical protein n=1 Tax=Rhizobium leguminosarum TaxID=384 RepID=UPI001C9546E3|nr:hypothetical protein [Rhizobium leguminosarum]MBY5446183.1 hypothetical protein [Rhizobium leguminosarum]
MTIGDSRENSSGVVSYVRYAGSACREHFVTHIKVSGQRADDYTINSQRDADRKVDFTVRHSLPQPPENSPFILPPSREFFLAQVE